ncbi:MAG: GGDEF domain-containing protein [Myxococcota bacterium]|nr:GGDEF domain-containing protein [Myxococcota bacterium]
MTPPDLESIPGSGTEEGGQNPELREIPAPPAGMYMIIKSAGDPEVSLQQLGQLVAREPSFTVELLRVANSAFFALEKEVRTVKQATVKLGARSVRNLAVAHAVRSTTAKLDLGAFDGNLFWEDSLRRAVCCRVLAETAGFEDPMEAFTVGLIQDIGTLFLAYLNPQHARAIQNLRVQPGNRRLEEEKRLCGTGHPEKFAEIASSWQFPSDLVDAVRHHHVPESQPGDRRDKRLGQLAHAADAMADIIQTKSTGTTVRYAQGLLESLPSRAPLKLDTLGEQLQTEMVHAASEVQIHIGRQPNFAELVSEANVSLVQITDDYEQLTQQLQALLEEKEELTRQLQRANSKLQQLASTDPLTNLANRRSFTEALNNCIDQVERGEPLCLILCDVDHFKDVNDNHGHGVGDEVLRVIARRLELNVRPRDLVGRIGGEEFAILLPDTGPSMGKIVAERLRRAIEAEEVAFDRTLRVRITASFGGTSKSPGAGDLTADQLLSSADHCLYQSKENGRNRVTWED